MKDADPTRRPARRARPGPDRPVRFEEALAQARAHARRAAAEAARAARALLDAAAIGATGVPAAGHEPLRRAARWLDELAAGAGDGAWPAALGAALDAEIGRWEARSRTDPEARAVLRAFLGVRELLWELGLRGPGAARGPAPERPPRDARAAEHAPRPGRTGGARRLERVPIDGGGPAGRTG